MSRNGSMKTAFLTILLSLLAATFVSAQNAVKNADATSASAEHQRVLKAYLAAFNAGDVEGLKKFAAERLSEPLRHGMLPERIAQNLLRFRGMVGGGFDLYKIEKNTDTEQVAVLKSHGEFPLFARQNWKFDAANPGLIVDRDMEPIETPSDALPPKSSADQLAKEIDTKLTKLVAEDKFSGAILIAKDGKPLWQKAYGYADREAKLTNNLDTRFRLGSMNKMFTSV